MDNLDAALRRNRLMLGLLMGISIASLTCNQVQLMLVAKRTYPLHSADFDQ